MDFHHPAGKVGADIDAGDVDIGVVRGLVTAASEPRDGGDDGDDHHATDHQGRAQAREPTAAALGAVSVGLMDW